MTWVLEYECIRLVSTSEIFHYSFSQKGEGKEEREETNLNTHQMKGERNRKYLLYLIIIYIIIISKRHHKKKEVSNSEEEEEEEDDEDDEEGIWVEKKISKYCM